MEQYQSRSSARFYRKIGTHGWHESSYVTLNYASPSLRRWIAARLEGRGSAILSVGCGAGELERYLAGTSRAVIGVDLSHEMLKRATKRYGLELAAQADAQSLPFAAASVDVVIFPESLGYLQLEEVFREAHRVLKRGGCLVLTTYVSHVDAHRPYRKYAIDDIRDSLMAADFRVQEQQYLRVKRNSVAEVTAESEAMLLYVSAVAISRR